MPEIWGYFGEGYKREASLMQERVRYDEPVGLDNLVVVIQDVDVDESCAPMLVPDAAQLLLNGLRLVQHRFWLQHRIQ